jgi:putative Mg2+ transporter-C (MgtC) family protein
MDTLSHILAAVIGEFSDLSADQAASLVIRLLIAGFVGGLIGWQRERVGKSAGLRTHILIALGAAAFMAVPHQAGLDEAGISRILQGLVTGVGFLGAGCILKSTEENQIHGLTTAAGVWLTAAAGVAAGLGRSISALLIGALGWFTLSTLLRWEHHTSVASHDERSTE